jgi:hypothetical protein
MIKISKRNIVVLLLLLSAYTFPGCSSVQKTQKQDDLSIETVSMEDKFGVQVVGMRPTAEGRMLNFRYKIIDPEKALSLINPKAKPYVIDQKTGKTVAVPSLPKVGALKQRGKRAYPGRIYFILFANPGEFIKPGDKVSVVIGDFKAEDIVVE